MKKALAPEEEKVTFPCHIYSNEASHQILRDIPPNLKISDIKLLQDLLVSLQIKQKSGATVMFKSWETFFHIRKNKVPFRKNQGKRIQKGQFNHGILYLGYSNPPLDLAEAEVESDPDLPHALPQAQMATLALTFNHRMAIYILHRDDSLVLLTFKILNSRPIRHCWFFTTLKPSPIGRCLNMFSYWIQKILVLCLRYVYLGIHFEFDICIIPMSRKKEKNTAHHLCINMPPFLDLNFICFILSKNIKTY